VCFLLDRLACVHWCPEFAAWSVHQDTRTQMIVEPLRRLPAALVQAARNGSEHGALSRDVRVPQEVPLTASKGPTVVATDDGYNEWPCQTSSSTKTVYVQWPMHVQSRYPS
jgi:hypothetical protein